MKNAKIKTTHIETLKQIALRGGCCNPVILSSCELGRMLGISQQSASKRILELLKAGTISRELGVRKQVLRLTQLGIEIIKKEHVSYLRIFEIGDRLTIRGTVVTGFGEGQYYLNHREYRSQFEQKLRISPFEGTLNLKVSGKELGKLESIKAMEGVVVKGFRKGGRTFGDVKCLLCKIRNIDCAVVFPTRSHYDDVVEIISKCHLRRTLGLKDGDEVEIAVNI